MYIRDIVNPSGNTALACSFAIPLVTAQEYAVFAASMTLF